MKKVKNIEKGNLDILGPKCNKLPTPKVPIKRLYLPVNTQTVNNSACSGHTPVSLHSTIQLLRFDMEPKPSPPPAANPRRRGAATKRKERAASTALSASTPPKRQARERAPVDQPAPPLPPPPKRQARKPAPVDQLAPPLPPPSPHAPPARPPARKSRRKPARKKASRCSLNPPREQEEEKEESPVPPPPPPPRPSLEQEFEAVISRGAGVHVVPTFAGKRPHPNT